VYICNRIGPLTDRKLPGADCTSEVSRAALGGERKLRFCALNMLSDSAVKSPGRL